MKIPPGRALGAEISAAIKGQPGLARGSEIRRAAEQPRNVPGDGIQRLARCVACGNAFAVGRKRRQSSVPAVRQLTAKHPIALVSEFGISASIFLEHGPPCAMQLRTARSDAVLEVLANPVRDEELGVRRPAIVTLRQPDFFLPQRLTVRRARILLVR